MVVNANDRFSTGVIALEVGGIEENVTVASRVSELQAESGERSFTLESEALKNIANNGRALFNFATLVPGVLQQDNARGTRDRRRSSGFTVNGQRPNSNNMTIDGVANIDTGDNGGNMATTNIDAVAEFKILTNAYQAEYGRAVGGQVQVVTKSGTQAFHGSGYWYGRRSDWNANTWTNKRAARRRRSAGAVTERPSPRATTTATRSAARSSSPACSTRTRRSSSSSGARSSSAARTRRPSGRAACPPPSSGAGDFSQSVDNSGNPFPYIRDYHDGPALQRRRHARLLPGRRRARPDPAEPALSARASTR